MRLFRSEEHVRGAVGAIFPLEQCWRLAQAWYGSRMDPAFAGRTTAEAQAILEGVGLTGDFWRL